METMENSGSHPPPLHLASGKEGWRQIFWKQSVPPGYQPRPRSPPMDPSTFIPGELWGASKEEIQQWRTNTGMGETATAEALDPNPPLTWGSPTFVDREEIKVHHTSWTSPSSESSHQQQQPFQRYGQLNWQDHDLEEVDEATQQQQQQQQASRTTGSLLFTTSPVKSFPNSLFSGAPIVPTSISESPKSALNALYGKVMTKTPLTEACYFHWDNGAPSHARRYTCVLVCPATYEIFPAGKYRSTATTASKSDIGMWVHARAEDEDTTSITTGSTTRATGLVWYSRKKEAAQGAAAFRYDCWYYREWLKNNPQAPKCHLLGKDIPYASPQEERPQTVLAAIPLDIMELIEGQIAKWKEQVQQRAREEEMEAMVAMEDIAYRTAYMETRTGTNQTTGTSTTSVHTNQWNPPESGHGMDDEDLDEEVESNDDNNFDEDLDEPVDDDDDDDDDLAVVVVEDTDDEDEITLPP